MKKVIPQHQSLYSRRFKDISERQGQIKIELPSDVDPDLISVDISVGKHCVLVCRFRDELPFIAGRTFAAISTHCRSVAGDRLTIRFTKAEPGAWPVLITGPAPGRDFLIDPFSAFQLAVLQGQQLDSGQVPPDDIGHARQNFDILLHIATGSGFPTALHFKAGMLMQDGGFNEAKSFLQTAAVDYGHVDSMHQLGLMGFMEGDPRSAAQWFRMAGEHGNLDAWVFFGEIYSPFEGEPSDLKDGELAREAFAAVLAKQENHPYACYGMAKLLLNGCGVEKDVGRAKELYIKAKQNGLSPETSGIVFQGKDLAEWVPEAEAEKNIEVPEAKEKISLPVIIAGAVLAVIGGFSLFRFLRRRKVGVHDE